MFTALVSLLTGRTVKSDTAMTGEISLRGLVLPVGGIKEKVIAAARAELATVILPERNRKDYEDIPEAARKAAAVRLGRAGRGCHRRSARSDNRNGGSRFGGQLTEVLLPRFASAVCNPSENRVQSGGGHRRVDRVETAIVSRSLALYGF